MKAIASLCVVDAFADGPFTGNPAAVCFPQARPASSWMQAVAGEMNLSETAFLEPAEAGAWELRWFTPMREVDLCGHATLAAAHALWASETVAEEPESVSSGNAELEAFRRRLEGLL